MLQDFKPFAFQSSLSQFLDFQKDDLHMKSEKPSSGLKFLNVSLASMKNTSSTLNLTVGQSPNISHKCRLVKPLCPMAFYDQTMAHQKTTCQLNR